MSNTRLDQHVSSYTPDDLINQTYPPADVFTVKLRAGQGSLSRGTVLALSTGDAGKEDMVILGTTADTDEILTANCILADPVETGSSSGATISALAYRTGNFNGNRLTVASGYTMSRGDKEALRTGGILLNDALSY